MTDKEINKKIQDMIKLPKTSNKRILAFVKKKECQTASLTPSTLGMLFEVYAGVKYNAEDDTTCFSRTITIEELEKIHPNFRSTNGCQWARSDTSYLGKKYKIKREHKNRKVYSVKLDGTNSNSLNRFRVLLLSHLRFLERGFLLPPEYLLFLQYFRREAEANLLSSVPWHKLICIFFSLLDAV